MLDNGTALGFARTFVPLGYAGPGADAGVALVANAGRYTLELPDDLTGARQSLISGPEVNSAFANLRRSFGGFTEAFVDVSRASNRGRTSYAGFLTNSVTLPAGAANNPFTTDIAVSFPATGIGY